MKTSGIEAAGKSIVSIHKTSNMELDKIQCELFSILQKVLILRTDDTEKAFLESSSRWTMKRQTTHSCGLQEFLEGEMFRYGTDSKKYIKRSQVWSSRKNRRARWLEVCRKAMELVKQQEQMRSRIMFLQLSMLTW